MQIDIIITSIVLMVVAGVVVSLFLGIAAKKFAVQSDPKEKEILNILPGLNCGSCGYIGCEQYAQAILHQNTDIDLCKPGGQSVVDGIAKVLGIETSKLAKKVAIVLCNGGDRCENDHEYKGIEKCSYASFILEGQKKCKYACLGFGDCVVACPFGAIFINQFGCAEVDPIKCTGCGICVKNCPKKIIKLIPCNYKVHIKCSSKDKGNIVKQNCAVGCIGCGLCVKICPVKDIGLEGNLAFMKYDKCDNCKLCAVKCPTKAIVVDEVLDAKEQKKLEFNLVK